jgi:hypothetical protein
MSSHFVMAPSRTTLYELPGRVLERSEKTLVAGGQTRTACAETKKQSERPDSRHSKPASLDTVRFGLRLHLARTRDCDRANATRNVAAAQDASSIAQIADASIGARADEGRIDRE